MGFRRRARKLSLRALSMLLVLLVTVLSACSSAASDLHTARDLYRDARYEAAAAWLASLERGVPSMSATDRATFHYLRGMTEYRLAQYQEALHDLALAAYAVSNQENALSPTQRSILDRTLSELMPQDASPYARSPRMADDSP